MESFSHGAVVYYFHRADPAKIELTARHPRNNPAWPKIGIFALPGTNRPNLLGVSTCRVIGIEVTSLLVQGLDAVDGTPVLDLKPLMKGFEPRGEIDEAVWAGEITAKYWSPIINGSDLWMVEGVHPILRVVSHSLLFCEPVCGKVWVFRRFLSVRFQSDP